MYEGDWLSATEWAQRDAAAEKRMVQRQEQINRDFKRSCYVVSLQNRLESGRCLIHVYPNRWAKKGTEFIALYKEQGYTESHLDSTPERALEKLYEKRPDCRDNPTRVVMLLIDRDDEVDYIERVTLKGQVAQLEQKIAALMQEKAELVRDLDFAMEAAAMVANPPKNTPSNKETHED